MIRSLFEISLRRSVFVAFAAFVAVATISSQAFPAQEFHFEKDVQNYERQTRENPPTPETTFFVGSSTFTRWSNIPNDFQEFAAVNRGFGGSQISDWLDVAADRLLTPHKPRRIVFYCGCNDIASGKSVERVVADYKAFVAKMRAANPDVAIHFCSLTLPTSRKSVWDKFLQYNEEVRKIAENDPKMFYVDFTTPTCDADGNGSDDYLVEDRLHLKRESELLLVPSILESLRTEKKRFALGGFGVELKKVDGVSVLSLYSGVENGSFDKAQVFASAPFANDVPVAVERSVDVENAVRLRLESGRTFAFAPESGGKLLAIDFIQPQNAILASEEPAAFELPAFNKEQLPRLKEFGSAGLKDVGKSAGSYAFIAVVDPATRSGVVGGWLTSEKAGGVIRCGKTTSEQPTMIPRLDYGEFDSGDRVLQERFVVGPFDDCRLGLEEYGDAIARYYRIVPKTNNIVGYCTWYSDKNGGACNENAIKDLTKSIVDNFGDFGFQYVQIDDRWQAGASKNSPNKDFTRVNPKGPYPSGMKATSDYLNANGLTAGVWFMPFSGDSADPYFADKQDLFVKSAIDYPAPGEKNTRRYSSINQKKGAPYETFWGGTALDMSNPKTREYVSSIVSRITQDWNYKYIKIDACWVASGLEQLYVNDEYIPDDMGKQIFFDPRTTNVENYRSGLQLVRDNAKETFVLGCNVSQNMRVMAASYGLVDAMRVGPDNGASWDGVCAGPWRGTNRYFYNGRVWWNDPDPVYARTSIPVDRARVSATWAGLTGQLFALSDWIPDYDAERIDLVRKTIPNHLRKTVRPVDLFDVDLARIWILSDDSTGTRRDVVGLFNWDGENESTFEATPEKLGLPLITEDGAKVEKYVGYSFWNDELLEPFDVLKTTLPKASCAVVAIRPIGNRPILLSTSRHISQGILEVRSENWNAETGTLTIVADVTPNFPYELRVYNPATGKLDRWTAPSDASGETTFEYRTNENGDATFSVVR